ncbi:MAG: DMT family transporter [Deltaproteobacteria bacterium]|nr:DMT family transporter [Deltaproteobacteria bacterium]
MSAQLVALFTAISYATALILARKGLRYSTPRTVTFLSIIIQLVTLWTAVFLTGGIPNVPLITIFLLLFVGLTQLGVRLFAYTGVDKIGASRSSALQSTSPLVSAGIAILVLQEHAGPAVLLGTVLVVCGIVLISWKPEKLVPTYRWWHLLLPLAAACLTGINHPIRRYALSLANAPLFYSAIMGASSLLWFFAYLALFSSDERLVWDRRAFWPFVFTGLCETLSILCIMTALSLGPVVVVAPLGATYPMWALLGSVVFLRDVERINFRTIAGISSVVAGTISINLAR